MTRPWGVDLAGQTFGRLKVLSEADRVLMSTKAEKAHMGRVSGIGCVLCLLLGYGATPAEVHHIRTGVGAGRRAPDTDTIGLCPEHHRGNTGLHGMGRKAFEIHYNFTELELLAEVRRILGVAA